LSSFAFFPPEFLSVRSSYSSQTSSLLFLNQDYRNDVISELRARGKTPEEIERFVPKTFEERQQYVKDQKNDLVKMKEDIAFLLKEVHELRQAMNATTSATNRSAGIG